MPKRADICWACKFVLQFLVKISAFNLAKNSGPPFAISKGSFHKARGGSEASLSFKTASDSSFETEVVPGSVWNIHELAARV